MDTKIRLKNIQIYGWHGISKEEKEKGQKFEIDIEIMFFINSVINDDDIKKTVNYIDLYEYVVKIFLNKKYNLIETLANDMSILIQKKYRVKSCKVVIRKPNAPINGILDTVEVEANSIG